MRYLFGCLENRGRSQIAEAYFHRYYSAFGHEAISAGITDDYVEEPIPEPVVNIMKEDGIDISNESIDHLTEDMADSVDRIVMLTAEEHWPDFLQNREVEYWPIQDNLKDAGSEGLRAARDEIKRRVLNLKLT